MMVPLAGLWKTGLILYNVWLWPKDYWKDQQAEISVRYLLMANLVFFFFLISNVVYIKNSAMHLSVHKKYTKVRPANPQKSHVQTLEHKGNSKETHPKPSKSPFL
jgi:hypothetical protein